MMTPATAVLRTMFAVAFCLSTAGGVAADATFLRAINLNGPSMEIDGRSWDGTNATNFSVSGKFFENQSVALKPATDPARARMIRSSVWGSKVDVELSAVPEGVYQVFLYVWEDTLNERFDLLVNDRTVIEFSQRHRGSLEEAGPLAM
jgi:chitinase